MPRGRPKGGKRKNMTESECVTELMKMYQKKVMEKTI